MQFLKRNELRSTEECNQMNNVYDMLEELQPTADQIRELWSECIQVALTGSESEVVGAFLFAHQLMVHVQKRNRDDE